MAEAHKKVVVPDTPSKVVEEVRKSYGLLLDAIVNAADFAALKTALSGLDSAYKVEKSVDIPMGHDWKGVS